jgi:Tfp pilus assembly protein PilF
MFYWNKRTKEGLAKAVELFEETVKMDPKSPLGYTGLALAYFIKASNYRDDPALYFAKAKDHAWKALSIDEGVPEAHAVIAAIASGYDRDYDLGEREFKRAIELNPNYPSAHQWYAQYLGALGRWDESWTEINRALELSPLSLIINTNIADGHFYRREFDKGAEQARKVIDMDPGFPPAHASLVTNLLWAGRYEELPPAMEAHAKLHEPLEVKGMKAYVFAHQGKKEDARKLADELSSEMAKELSPYGMAQVYFAIGDDERGFEMLEKAYEVKDRYLAFMWIDFDLMRLRGDPRFQALLQKTGLAGRIRA